LRYFSGSGIGDMYYKEQVKPIKRAGEANLGAVEANLP
jgi:hypothetical protein